MSPDHRLRNIFGALSRVENTNIAGSLGVYIHDLDFALAGIKAYTFYLQKTCKDKNVVIFSWCAENGELQTITLAELERLSSFP